MSRRRPNIVLFMTDQLRRDALGCYGNTVCRTPRLDRLAGEGALFENAFTTSPVCSPARASLLTGLYPHNHGVMLNTHIAPAWSRALDPALPTFSSILKGGGYALDYVGKLHVNQALNAEAYGFDRHATPKWGGRAREGTELRIDLPGGNVLAAADSAQPKDEHLTWRYTEQGLQFIRERAAGEQPFFLRIDVHAPHFPCVPPEPYASMYEPAAIPPWPNFAETFAGKPASHLRKHRTWHLEGRDWTWWSRVVARYYGEISLIDECVGRVLDTVSACGIEDETIFVFSTDHGDAMGSHRHFEKGGTMYDEVYRIPLIVRMPRPAQAVSHVRQIARLMDLMPTIVDWAELALPQPVDARSLLPLIEGRPCAWPDSVYCEHHGEVWGYQSQRMVRTGRWKYVFNPHDLDELYDLRSDPAELVNLSESPDHADVLREMMARMIGWNDHTRDMFQWSWVRWGFPAPVKPDEVTREVLPLTCEAQNSPSDAP